ncbi:transglycosylase domain-containing protein [Corynebacterium guangdongense]|uniref:Membrane peptidoglycan carboxypeptidase n=1 Tax=Corynebacterium guangdongense TaxID=1783348 RepID=A0ABU2A009_9CORY|nr:transglycosylase domain-containing protein [Corynebacterium guangdongense]MDR7330531.1 membrane peptidoglycan carboxypeptidase [Corynebacterium guangdongense]WJZ19086.1 Penicillin-binding protein 1A [Corynebacterium guangdongense]
MSIWSVVGAAAAVVIAIPVIAFFFGYVRVDIPEPQELTTAQVSSIYATDSETELARIVPPEGNRTTVPLEVIPDHVQNAVLAAEDREFWTNPGFSFSGFARAAVGVVTGNDAAGGGSTITQQYVKNTLVGNERSIERKWKEMVYSVKMTNQWDKETILEAYLNTVYFGRNAYGIEAAANAYFNKPAAELTPAEGAVLAATIQLPSQLDPWSNPEGAEARWNYVLDGMLETGAITQEQRDSAQFPQTRDPAEYSAYTEARGTNGHIKNHVMAELAALGISEEDVTTRGLQITTTIDMKAQNATLDAVYDGLSTLQDDAAAGVASVEPGTGAIRAYYGGEDAAGWDYANAALQTGSVFKIFGLAAALQQGIPLSAQYSSAPVTLPGNIPVTNVTGSCGTCSIEHALLRSYNTSFIRLQDDLYDGTQDTADMAHALGVARSLPGIPETLTENGDQPYEGIILGQYQSRAIDLAVALATVANGGVYQPTHWVERVETANGDVLYQWEQGEGERRVSKQVADNLLSAMEPIAAWSGGKGLAGGRPSASKTGTAQFGDTGANKDAWMLGATPQLSTAVWVGTADNTSAIYNEWGGNMYGSGTPTDIWKSMMDTSHEGLEVIDFPTPEPIQFGLNGYTGGSSYSDYVYDPYYAPPAPVVTNVAPAPAPSSAESADVAPAPQEAPPAEAPAPTPAPAPEEAPAPPANPDPGPPIDIELPPEIADLLPTG